MSNLPSQGIEPMHPFLNRVWTIVFKSSKKNVRTIFYITNIVLL